MSPAIAKPQLRTQSLTRRDGLAVATRTTLANACASLVEAHVLRELAPGSTVALYAQKASELGTDQLAEACLARRMTLCYPRVVPGSKVLAFAVAKPSELTPARFGVPEPSSAAPTIALPAIDVMFVPGLAFDRRGRRLGWGQGYYDTTISAGVRALRVGLAYECQIVDVVPTAPHDEPVHLLITESHCYPCAG